MEHRRFVLWGFIFTVISQVFGIASPRIIRLVINGLREGIEKSELLLYSGLVIGIALASGVFKILSRRMMSDVARKVECELRRDLFSNLQILSPSFYTRYRTGDLMARATNDLEAVRMLLGPGIINLSGLLLFMFAFSLMLSINVWLTLLTLVPLPAIVFMVNRLASKVHRLFRNVQEGFSSITSKVQENISGIRVVKIYAQEENETDDFRRLNSDYLEKNRRLIKTRSFFFPLIMLFGGVSMVIILWIGGLEVISGRMNLGQFVEFTMYLSMLMWPMGALGWVIDLFQRGRASASRIFEIIDAKPDITEGVPLMKPSRLFGEIEFKDVSLSYGGSVEAALKDIDLTIKSGTTVGIVGPVGSGKSTLVRLIPRLMDPDEGEVLIDGIPVRKLPLSFLRSSVGYVSQDTFLFSEPIWENIAYGAGDASIEKVRKYADMACVGDEITAFPEGYNTIPGERGVTLSGGQKQRIAIARALILDPSVLILDDAFSSVDVYAEREILSEIMEFVKGRTLIIVSHRISTVMNADLIVTVDGGRIFERGTHSELISKDGIYSRLYRRQLIAEELGEI